MAVIGNIATAIGDIIIMKAGIPMLGISAINSFTDVIVGETVDRYFQKEFRCTIDGINWQDWQDLTNLNLQSVGVEVNHILQIEYKYTRVGTDNTGDLSLESIELDGDFPGVTISDIYWDDLTSQLIYLQLYDLESLEWARNVLEKIYKEGILPKYIERNLSGNANWEDRDFIDFWFSVTHFFSLIVRLSRAFQNFSIDEELLKSYLESKGLFISKDMNYDELYYLMQSYFEQIRLRGTPNILQVKNSNNYVNGELLRVINKATFDEFIFALVERNKSVWNINNSSPLYRGTVDIRNLIKGYESTDEVVDLANYPLLNSAGVSIVSYLGEDIILFQSPITTPTGIGSSVWDNTKAIIIDPSIDYEISFWVNQVGLNSNLYFGVNTYDRYGNLVPIYNIDDFHNTDGFFLEAEQVNKINTWYFVRGIIFNKDEATRSSDPLNIGIGQNLRFDKRTFHIIPFLYSSGSAIDSVRIKNFQIRPLKTTFQRGFIGVPIMILTWMKNKSVELSNSKIEEIMRTYLLPYNSVSLNNWI